MSGLPSYHCGQSPASELLRALYFARRSQTQRAELVERQAALYRLRCAAMKSQRRRYYDHEPAYQRIALQGGVGWDDLNPEVVQESYVAIEEFLRSPLCPTPASSVRVLDAGCGGGQVALRLAALGFEVTGVDFAETAIRLASRNAEAQGASIDFRVGDCVELTELEDASSDLVVDNHLLHCLIGEDRLAFLRSARRVMRKGAILFSDTMCHGPRLDMDALDIDPRTRITRSRTRFWVTKEELLLEIAGAGFEIVHQVRREENDEPNAGDMLTTVLRRPV